MSLQGECGGLTIVACEDIDILSEGVDLGPAEAINFVGSGVSTSVVNGTATVTILGGGGGTGDVIGPADSTDNAITTFDGLTGKLIQAASASVDDNGNISGVSYRIGGQNALSYPRFDNITGNSIAIGVSALNVTTSAAYSSIAIGYKALSGVLTTTAVNNIVIGTSAGILLTQGSNNTIVGTQAGVSISTGAQHTAVGSSTNPGSSGSRNTIFGYAGGVANNSGTSDAVIVGTAGGANTNTVAIGRLCGSSMTNVTGNSVLVGHVAGRYLSSGLQNTFVGAFSGTGLTGSLITGNGNTGLGYNSLAGLITTASGNTALGANAGALITTGNRNTIIGAQVGSTTLQGGSSNILIGVDATTDVATSAASHNLIIKGTGTAVISSTNLDTTPQTTLGGIVTATSAAWISPTITTPTFSGNPNGTILSGTYTPTLTAVTNVAASVAQPCFYLRVGNQVYVWGYCSIDPTLAAATSLGISLPIASNFGTFTDAEGTGASASFTQCGYILADTTNDRVQLDFLAANLANAGWGFNFAYTII
jgi:hypothetical protein